MRKIFSTLLLLAIFLTSTIAMAAFKEEVAEGTDVNTIKRLAVALPMHYKTEDAEPTFGEFIHIISDSGKNARCYVLSYDEVAADIMQDTGIDIKFLQDEESRKVYQENIAKYADAFLVVTTANNNKHPQFFFEVYDAKSGDLVYLLTTQSGSIGKNAKDYGKACSEFYSKFDAAAEKSIKDSKKKNK